jgi:hypothetical protein
MMPVYPIFTRIGYKAVLFVENKMVQVNCHQKVEKHKNANPRLIEDEGLLIKIKMPSNIA